MRSSILQNDAVAPDIELPALDGRRHRLIDYRGRSVVLLFYRGHW